MNAVDLCLEVVSRSRQPLRYIWCWISRKPLRDTGLVPKDHQWEMAYGISNGHVTDDVTWPWKVKLVTPIRLERNTCYLENGWWWRVRSKGLTLGNGIWAIKWSRDRWRHVTPKGAARQYGRLSIPNESLASRWWHFCRFTNFFFQNIEI